MNEKGNFGYDESERFCRGGKGKVSRWGVGLSRVESYSGTMTRSRIGNDEEE